HHLQQSADLLERTAFQPPLGTIWQHDAGEIERL
ncbi:Hypothetical predicted protein, partial [Cloeon dipterum]